MSHFCYDKEAIERACIQKGIIAITTLLGAEAIVLALGEAFILPFLGPCAIMFSLFNGRLVYNQIYLSFL